METLLTLLENGGINQANLSNSVHQSTIEPNVEDLQGQAGISVDILKAAGIMKPLFGFNFIAIVICTIVVAMPTITSADCLSDSLGRVICGAGECARNPTGGMVYCSAYFFGKAIVIDIDN